MKRLSDYKGEDAIELWGDLIEPLTVILGDKEIADIIQSGKPKLMVAKTILSNHKKEAEQILMRIDDSPLDGLNILMRLLAILADIGENEEIKSFFGFAGQETAEKESTGSVTENTEDAEK